MRSAGESDTRVEYAFSHVPSSAGLYYYRLRQVDADGAVAYSATEVVDWDGGAVAVSGVCVTAEGLTFTLDGTREVSVVDVRGAVVVTGATEAGANAVSLAGVPHGAYVLSVAGESVPFVW